VLLVPDVDDVDEVLLVEVVEELLDVLLVPDVEAVDDVVLVLEVEAVAELLLVAEELEVDEVVLVLELLGELSSFLLHPIKTKVDRTRIPVRERVNFFMFNSSLSVGKNIK
jgi:hypothetical protein